MSAADPAEPRHPWWASPPPEGGTRFDGLFGDPGSGPDEDDGAARSGSTGQDPPPWGGHDHGPEHVHVDACQVCPVCTLLRVAGEVRPDLLHHLAEAARHVTLAAKAIIDAQARGWERGGGLQHVPLDDE